MLAPACGIEAARQVAGVEHATRQRFGAVASGVAGDEGTAQLDALLDGLARRIGDAASEVSLERLMSELPGRLEAHPERVLALLDLVATEAFDASEDRAAKLAVVDCVITIVCTGGDPHGQVAPEDPATITPVIEHLTRRAEAECRERLAEIEADFFNAANLSVDLGESEGMNALRARKAKLGRVYFAPGMLRAIVTYNMALQQSRQPWTCEVTGDEEIFAATAVAGSVFASAGLRAVHAAAKRRLAREADRAGAAARIARSIPLDELDAAERKLLCDGAIAPTDLACSVVLLGLLCRGGEPLALDLQEIGIDPDRVAGAWTEELDQLVRLEVNEAIMGASAGVAYQAAQKLSALRDRWLYATVSSQRREARTSDPRPRPAPVQTEEEQRRVRAAARKLAGEAVAGEAAPEPRRSARRGISLGLPWQIVASAAALLVLATVLGLHTLGFIDLLGRNLDRWSGDELAAISEYLESGHRNGGGSGSAFVGTVGEEWDTLAPHERQSAGLDIVWRLRARGVAQVMVYDGDRRLRIQGLGETFQAL